MEKENDSLSLIKLLCATLIFGTIGIVRSMIPLSSGFVAMCRGFSGAAIVALFCLITKHPLRNNIGRKNFWLCVLSGVFIGLNWIFLFESYIYSSVPVASLLNYMEPTLVILLSPIFLNENLTKKKIICAIVAIIGMVFVSGIVDEGIPSGQGLKGIIYGFLSGLLYAALVIVNKRMPKIDSYEKTVIQLTTVGIIMVPYLISIDGFSGISFTSDTIFYLALICIIHTGLAYTLYFDSMKNLRGQTIAILSYIDPITTLILSALILDQKLTVLGIFGAVLILGATFESEIDKNTINKFKKLHIRK